jgi:hypothetical protein
MTPCRAGKPPTALFDAKVTCVQNLTPNDDPKGKKCAEVRIWTVRMDDSIGVQVTGYTGWRDSPGGDKDKKESAVHLFLAGIELENLELRPLPTDETTKADVLWTKLEFDINKSGRESDNRVSCFRAFVATK